MIYVAAAAWVARLPIRVKSAIGIALSRMTPINRARSRNLSPEGRPNELPSQAGSNPARRFGISDP